jgi:hypothetical protein
MQMAWPLDINPQNAVLACCPEQQLIINCFRLREQHTKKKKLYNHGSDKDYSVAAANHHPL